MDDWRLRVSLERVIELPGAQLRLRDWPGLGGPLIHVPDPLSPDAALVERLADTLTPQYRVMSVAARGASAYQVDAADLLATLDVFGFAAPVVVGERLGCVAALLHAAWYPGRVAGLVLVEPAYEPPASDGVLGRAMRDCPPDWTSLRGAIECPVLVLAEPPAVLEDLQRFLTQLGPGVI
ncbi:MAG: alpha/beta hydrolase [Chloroflexota bacterium]|nr:alpha/beta hydrolase [Chloroflexota bacterium]